jgi:hypothetical protein
MKWANFLHIYQPENQADDIFDRVVNESYRPLFKSLRDNPKARITININAVLAEQFVERGYKDIIEDIKYVASRGQIEFTDTAKYHALLPFLDEFEIRRQIMLNRKTNEKIFGAVYKPTGFFPPEMAYAPFIAPILDSMGYRWMIVDEIAFNGRINQADTNTIYTVSGTKLNVFFRERNPSNLIMSALVRREQDFHELMGDEYKRKGYMITGMDGETFGHHRPGLQKLLTGLLNSDEFEHVFLGELPDQIKGREKTSPLISTWASTEKDIEEGKQFLTWHDENNLLHTLEWELFHLALKTVRGFKGREESIQTAREKLDIALASDHFFWASAKPWWSLEVIESGAWGLLDALRSVPGISGDILLKAESIYHKIISTSFEWQRTGHIRKLYRHYKEHARIPFKDETKGKGEPWVYDAFIELMRQAMSDAAKNENFEKATLWRDAIWKLETKNDIYDALHAIDLLRKEVTNAEVLDMIGKYRREYERLSSGQPEQRGS